ncbi:hypothetical protein NG825_00240 [Xanthomonas sacchari]|nr:hypothetical protein NG825_00240 [Xanthomonas sacchari]
MSDLITSVATAIQLTQRLREINKNIANAEFSNVLADLSMELAEVKIQLTGLREENEKLRRQIAHKESLELVFKDFAYFSKDNDGPFCPGCYDSSSKIIRLTKLSQPFTVFGSHSCPTCKQKFGGG